MCALALCISLFSFVTFHGFIFQCVWKGFKLSFLFFPKKMVQYDPVCTLKENDREAIYVTNMHYIAFKMNSLVPFSTPSPPPPPQTNLKK